jgi:hypothetical protein
MAEYISAWNEILRNRQSSSFILTATLSNVGRFDSFVRSKGKVVIGHSTTQKHELIVEEYGESGEKIGRALYIPVKSREAKTVNFIARLDHNERDSVRGTFESALVYVRLGLLVSTGTHESKIISPLSPFSVKAREQHDEKVNSLKVNL